MHVIIIICFFKNDYRIELNFCLHCASLLTICTGSTMVSLCILKRANPGRRSRPIMFLRSLDVLKLKTIVLRLQWIQEV